MISGRAYNSIDEAGRMFMPAKYCGFFDVERNADEEDPALPPPSKLRKNYAGKCVIVHSEDRCLYVYPLQNWRQFIKDMNRLPSDDDEVRDLLRHYVGTATFCDIDKQGRLTIPQDSRNYAGLTRELVCVGMLDVLEIWDRVTHENTEAGKDFKAISKRVSKLRRELENDMRGQ